MPEYHILQKLILNLADEVPDSLYHFGNYHREEGALLVDAGGFLLFRSYFNVFSARQWKELTGVEKILFQLSLQGEGELEIWKANATGNISRVLTIPFSFSEQALLQTALLCLNDLEEVCWVCVRSGDVPVKVFGGAVLTDILPSRIPKLALCFCTFKREKEIRRNVQDLLSAIEDPASPLYEAADIFVADNGHTLAEEDFGCNNRVFLFRNPNFGGSAGFARCMIESAIHRKGRYSHVILMDDDAVIRSYVMERTFSLLSFLRPDYQTYMLGGALFSLQEPWMQAENGGEFRNRGTLLNRKRLDMRVFNNILRNMQPQPHIHVNYNAWFFACYPAELISEKSLPLPLFLHGDDIEYSLRNHLEIIRMNGICVWHPKPASIRRPYMAYYDHRNFSIIEALCNPEMKAVKFLTTEFRKIFKMVTELRYVEALYAIRGIHDFLNGPELLMAQDHEALNRDLMKWMDFEPCQIANIESCVFSDPLSAAKPRLNKTLDFLLPARKEQRVYDINTTAFFAVNYAGVKDICFVDRASGKGVVLHKNDPLRSTVTKEWWKLARRIPADYPAASTAWRAYSARLESLSFWKEYLKI